MTDLSSEIDIHKDYNLQKHNTLALPACAQYFCAVSNLDQLHQALSFAKANNLAITPLGQGSNLVLAGDITGLVIALELKGIEFEAQGAERVLVALAAGENWHDSVAYCLEQGFFGLENLALIPGTVGAAPIQNIGAYGVELSDFFVSLTAMDIAKGELLQLTAKDCEFAYRSSIFKQQAIDKYIIVSVCLELSRTPQVNADYPALKLALGGVKPSPKAVFDTVCRIRREKLPDPAEIPNVGSFFKNPVVVKAKVNQLLSDYPDMPYYSQSKDLSKIPAAWLIEQCGYKGYRQGNVGVHDRQALVLVNFQGKGKELLALAKRIEDDIKQKFDIELEVEPRIYGQPS